MAIHRAKVTEGGRVVIPAGFRRQLGLQPGAEVVMEIADGELRIRSVRQAIGRAQSLVRQYVATDLERTDQRATEVARRE
jgi:antitoxin PrlF